MQQICHHEFKKDSILIFESEVAQETRLIFYGWFGSIIVGMHFEIMMQVIFIFGLQISELQ